MIYPTYQTQTGVHEDAAALGNCLIASMATITGIPLADIPHFVADYVGGNGMHLDDLTAAHWLTILARAQEFLTANGFDTRAVGMVKAGPELLGTTPRMHLALVKAHGSGQPHIIVTDARGIQVWDPNPTAVITYWPDNIEAMLEVVAYSPDE